MPKSHAPYPPEFRTEAIRLLRTSGKSMAQIGRELEVTTRPYANGSSRPTSTMVCVTMGSPPRRPKRCAASAVR